MLASAVSLTVGAALALSLVAPPGPMNALIADETVEAGWGAGVRAGFGAFVADALFCALALSGAATFARSPNVRAAASLVGGLLMLYLAYSAARGTRTESKARSRGFTKALLLGLTNPYQIGWWLTAGVALVHPSSVEVAGFTVVAGGAPVLVGFFSGILVWITAFPSVLVRAEERVRGLERTVRYVSAAVLVAFAGFFVYYATTLA